MRKKRAFILIGIVVVIFSSIFMSQFFTEASAATELQISIAQVRIVDIGLTSCEVVVRVNLTNPTNQNLDIRYAIFDVFIADSYVGKSSISDVVLPQVSSREQSIPVTLLYSDIAGAVLQGIRNRNFDLFIQGDVQARVFYGLWIVTVPFSMSSTYSSFW